MVLSAGRTKAGCWANFMSITPAPRAQVKAMRKHKNKPALAVMDQDIIEISSDEDSEL